MIQSVILPTQMVTEPRKMVVEWGYNWFSGA
jgi:hypothetical protein